MIFEDRRDAGRVLAQALENFRDQPETVVLALPRGGVPVAYEIARRLNLPLDVFIVRKLGAPGQEELALGALASGGTVVLNQTIVHELGISMTTIDTLAEREKREIERRELAYREGHPPERIDGCTVILVDDGVATGASMLAAVRALRPRAKQVIVAVPVAAEVTCEKLRAEVDQVICGTTPQTFFAVGMFYHQFEQTTDEEVRSLLAKARSEHTSRRAA